ncbi:hypothetical protein K458DRAFT_451772 [Lentithecium fluviatile CBS 122367]|uniref:Rhodopsin domain-containing protein n=1 Tax=Lentithecium fluviatile CBS 122367 TaxID=1168545 RepID=A0A6G1J1L6_9PLEO|nr:hypothetical protein K458DRAFT_451772 [Lentithecium fluviatile CBS 122367]
MIKPEGRGLTFAIIISIWAVLSTLTIALKIWARYTIRAFGVDDWLMVFGWLIFMIVLVCDFLSISYGIGAHADRITDYEAMETKKLLFSDIGYAIATAPIKASICVLLMRLTAGTGKRIYRWILTGVILLACIGTITRVTAYTTRCKPFAAAWELRNNGHCSSAAILTNATWFFSAVQIGFILALGMLAPIATIIRMKHVIDFQKTNDFLFGLVDVALWPETETFLGIVAGSLATMHPLLRYFPFFPTSSSAACIEGAYGTLSDQIRGVSLHSRAGASKHNKSIVVENTEYMDHSFQISTCMVRDEERGDADAGETASQRHILRSMDMDIVKETQYEVRSEESAERDDVSQRSARGIRCGF